MSTWIGTCAALLALLILLAPVADAAEDPAIERAIQHGVAYLKQLLQAQAGDAQGETLGATALAGLALLECGVDTKDPVIQKTAKLVRQRGIDLTYTYAIALSILFLDRLGEPQDVALIESLTVRLLAGQTATGGWSYYCPEISAAEARRLKTGANAPASTSGRENKTEKQRTTGDLPPEIIQQLAILDRLAVQATSGQYGDNSNTQFAILALWVSRRHGLPVDRALARVETRFRGSQNLDGGWGYSDGSRESTPSMTCAGLLGLAVVYGAANEARLRTFPKGDPSGRPAQPVRPLAPLKDQAVQDGLIALQGLIGRAFPGGLRSGQDLGDHDYYFLWSLERVMMALGWQRMGRLDWYQWGARIIVATQNQDGSWHGRYGANGADTCFALLFLRRSNLAHDLTARLNLKDAQEVKLKASGTGAERLQERDKTLVLDGAQQTQKSGPSAGEQSPRLPTDLDKLPSATSKRAPSTPPEKDTDPEVDRLTSELIGASRDRQEALIARLRDSKGVVHTQALAAALPQLSGASKVKARDALAERLTRMTASTLRDKLQDENPEIRRSAALACAMKADQQHVKDLLPLLEDSESLVSRAAHVALTTLTKQDFGPQADAGQTERAKAIAQWKDWLAKRTGSPVEEKPSTDNPAQDWELLPGTWTVVSLQRGGKPLPRKSWPGLFAKFEKVGPQLTFAFVGQETPATCSLNPLREPKEIDLVTEGRETSRAIYKLEGDVLTICGVPEGEERPKTFATKPGTMQILFVLKRHNP